MATRNNAVHGHKHNANVDTSITIKEPFGALFLCLLITTAIGSSLWGVGLRVETIVSLRELSSFRAAKVLNPHKRAKVFVKNLHPPGSIFSNSTFARSFYRMELYRSVKGGKPPRETIV